MTQDRSDVALVKYAELLSALPRLFPRVKMVGFYDSDNLTAKYVRADRRLNDYSLTDSPTVLQTLAHCVASDYFLSRVFVKPQTTLPDQISTLTPGRTLRASDRVSVLATTYDLTPSVIIAIDGKQVRRQNTPGLSVFDLKGAALTPGSHHLQINVYDVLGRRAGGKDIPFTYAP